MGIVYLERSIMILYHATLRKEVINVLDLDAFEADLLEMIDNHEENIKKRKDLDDDSQEAKDLDFRIETERKLIAIQTLKFKVVCELHRD